MIFNGIEVEEGGSYGFDRGICHIWNIVDGVYERAHSCRQRGYLFASLEDHLSQSPADGYVTDSIHRLEVWSAEAFVLCLLRNLLAVRCNVPTWVDYSW